MAQASPAKEPIRLDSLAKPLALRARWAGFTSSGVLDAAPRMTGIGRARYKGPTRCDADGATGHTPVHPTSASVLEICPHKLTIPVDTIVGRLASEQRLVGNLAHRKSLEIAQDDGLAILLRQRLDRGGQAQTQPRMFGRDRPPAAPPRHASSATINCSGATMSPRGAASTGIGSCCMKYLARIVQRPAGRLCGLLSHRGGQMPKGFNGHVTPVPLTPITSARSLAPPCLHPRDNPARQQGKHAQQHERTHDLRRQDVGQ